jgi:hypothetical protein
MATAKNLLGATFILYVLATSSIALSPAPRETRTYKRVKAYLDAVPAIDTHDHHLKICMATSGPTAVAA